VVPSEQIGDRVGEVSYMLNEHACADHVTENGDAAYLPIGTKHETGIFLRVHLQDGTSFRMVYYPKANAFSAGAFGTEKIQSLIVSQRKEIKAATGL